MKIKLLITLFFLSFSINAQLVLLDEPTGTGSAGIVSLSIYDNDIVYTMIKDNTSSNPGIFVSNGVPGDRKELLAGTVSSANFHKNISQDGRRLYGNGNFKVGKNIYAAVRPLGTSTSKIYRFNASRTFLTPENIFKQTTETHQNISLVGSDELLTIDSIKVDNKNRLRIHHFTKEGLTYNYILPEVFYGSTRPSSFFNWDGALHFVAKISGESDLYKVDALGTVRVTQNKVSKPTSFKGVTPTNILLDDFIYFTGRDGFYTNVTPGPVKRNYPTAICYSNGDIDFGKNETAIYNGDDGSLGYKANSDTGFTANILGKIGDNLVYYRSDSKNFYSILNNVNLGLPVPQEFKFIQHNNKIYLAPRKNITEKLYVIDSNLAINSVNIPPFPATSSYAQNVGNFVIKGDKIYFIANYFFSGKSRHVLYSYNDVNNELTVELEFPEDIMPNTSLFYAYNKGFIFRIKTTNFSKESLYTWNVETRAKILDNGSAKGAITDDTVNFKYNENTYTLKSNNTIFNEADQLKVQILDTLSTQFKETIKQLPANTDKRRMSTLFYTLNTLKASNSHQSNFTLSFNDAMFTNTTTKAENLSVMAFYNDNWTEITATSFDNDKKEITINNNFPEEAFLFLKNNQVLSLSNSLLNSEISIYPNPTSSKFTVKTVSKNIQKIELFNILGKKVFTQNINNKNSVEINTNVFSKGIYLIKVFSENKILSKKLLIN